MKMTFEKSPRITSSAAVDVPVGRSSISPRPPRTPVMIYPRTRMMMPSFPIRILLPLGMVVMLCRSNSSFSLYVMREKAEGGGFFHSHCLDGSCHRTPRSLRNRHSPVPPTLIFFFKKKRCRKMFYRFCSIRVLPLKNIYIYYYYCTLEGLKKTWFLKPGQLSCDEFPVVSCDESTIEWRGQRPKRPLATATTF